MHRMARKPPPRLHASQYLGRHRYFLTICARHRDPVFRNAPLTNACIDQLHRCATDYTFAVIAYCFMPDHLHLLSEGEDETSDLQEFLRIWKQRTAFHVRREPGAALCSAATTSTHFEVTNL